MKKIYIILATIAALVTFSSCEDFLDRQPMTQLSVDTFFASDADFGMAADNLYGNFVRDFSDFWLDFRSDMTAVYGNKSGNRSYSALYDGSMTTSSVSMFWNYTAVRNALLFLDNLSAKGKDICTPANYNLYEGTAYYSLAYTYFKLFQAYESVPLVKEVLSDTDCDIAKSPKEDVWAYALECVDKAINDLPSLGPGERERGRLTKLVALTLKADMTLYASTYYNGALSGASYSDAASAATAALTEADAKGYGLAENFDNLFNCEHQAEADAQKEIIFEKVYLKDVATNTINPQFAFLSMPQPRGYEDAAISPNLVERFQYKDGKTAGKSALYDPKHPWDNMDPRFSEECAYPGKYIEYADGTGFIYNSLSPDSYDADGNVVGPELGEYIFSTADAATIDRNASGYLCYKYWDRQPSYSTAKSYQSFINYRYGELLLMYAEAILNSKGASDEVYSALTKLRARPSVGMPAITAADYPTKESLMQCIMDERVIELMFEGKRYFDNKRWHRMKESLEMRHHIIGVPVKFDSEGNPTEWATSIDLPVSVKDPTKTVTFELPAFDDARINFQLGQSMGDRDYIWPIPQNAIDRSNSGALVQHDIWK